MRCSISSTTLRASRRASFGLAQVGLDALAAIELTAVVLGKECTSLALFLLRGQFGHELRQHGAPEGPQLAQLIEDQGRIGGFGLRQTRLQALQHLLHARRGAFLLLDAILEALQLVLQRRYRLSSAPRDCGTGAARVHRRPRACPQAMPRRRNPSCRISFMSGAMMCTAIGPNPCSHRQLQAGWCSVNRWPRSAQYSSHLFSIMLRVQR